MTVKPVEDGGSAELLDCVFSLRRRVEQLEEDVHDLKTRQDPGRYVELCDQRGLAHE